MNMDLVFLSLKLVFIFNIGVFIIFFVKKSDLKIWKYSQVALLIKIDKAYPEAA